jgi:DnaJ-like protein
MRSDYYAILDITPWAGQEVVHEAYRRLALKYHPTFNQSATAYERMKEINEAWEVLSDPERRELYDRSRLHAGEIRHARPDENRGVATGQAQVALAPSSLEIFHHSRNTTEDSRFGWGSIWRLGIGIIFFLPGLLSLVAGQTRLLWIEGFVACTGVLSYLFFRGGGIRRLAGLGLAALSIASLVVLVLGFRELYLTQRRGLEVLSGSPNVASAASSNSSPTPTPKPSATPTPNPSPTPTATPSEGCPSGCVEAPFGCVIKARVDPDGIRVYYLPSDQAYYGVLMDPSSSDRWFCTEAEAIAQGWLHYGEAPTATPTSEVPASVTPVDPRTLFVCAPSANVRSGAGLEFPIVKQSAEGSTWKVLGKLNGWYYVGQSSEGQGYYIHETLLCSEPPRTATASSTPDSRSNDSGASASGFKYQAPVLVSPPNSTGYHCSRDLQLEWTFSGAASLTEDEWFLVESRQSDHENWFGITDWTKSQSVLLHPIKSGGKCDAPWWPANGPYEWRVIVIAGDISTHTLNKLLSPASSSLTIQYSP